MIKMVQSGGSKVCFTNLKNKNVKDNKSITTKLNCHIFILENLDVHVCKKINTLELKGGGVWGAISPEVEEILKIKQNGGFSFIFSFLAGLSKSPKLYTCSPAPLK